MRADGYVKGVRVELELAPIDSTHHMRTDAAEAFLAMRRAANEAGIVLGVNSAFRGMGEQLRLRQAWMEGRGNLAARPGFSNHQGGIAVDIQTGGEGTAVYAWLAAHAAEFDFVRTVPSEPWHWEFRPTLSLEG